MFHPSLHESIETTVPSQNIPRFLSYKPHVACERFRDFILSERRRAPLPFFYEGWLAQGEEHQARAGGEEICVGREATGIEPAKLIRHGACSILILRPSAAEKRPGSKRGRSQPFTPSSTDPGPAIYMLYI